MDEDLKERKLIRFIRPEEVETLVDLCEKHAAFERANYDKRGKKASLSYAIFGETPHLHCLVALDDAKIIGYATYMTHYSTWDARLYTYLDCLYLDEPARGKGMGRQLMLAVKVEVLKLGCDFVQWQTPDFNVDAIGFYRKLGATSQPKERFCWTIFP